MEVVADLHLHSKYSRAVSQQMILPEMARWASVKGIDLLGTGDFTHPLWIRELKSSLEEQGEGVFGLKNGENKRARFLLTAEISSIYSQAGRTRKIHNLIVAPSFEAAEKINNELFKKGCNLQSDGRPIIGLSAKDLLDLVLTVEENCLFIPCHVWTPWFSLYGSNSGFDSIDECFGDLSKYIYAVETGLSSDPQMNWRIAELEGRSIVSFSDAHSGSKLGREATVFQLSDQLPVISYQKIQEAILGQVNTGSRSPETNNVSYTIEFYPEEGKYHWTGHRNCKVIYSPEDTIKKGTTCPVCLKRMTVGVMERVEKLGGQDRVKAKVVIDDNQVKWISLGNRPPFVKFVPLVEIIAEVFNSAGTSQKVINEYNKLTDTFGAELKILMQIKPEEISKISGERMAEGILRVRKGEIFIRPGFDGVFGEVKIWGREGEKDQPRSGIDQLEMF